MNMKEVPILSYEKKTVETEDRFLDAKMGKLENEKNAMRHLRRENRRWYDGKDEYRLC